MPYDMINETDSLLYNNHIKNMNKIKLGVFISIPKFKEHRHDQSVISLLKKKYGFCLQEYGTLKDEVYLPIHPSRKRHC